MIIACIKVGTKYGPEYVNRLAVMISHYTTIPMRFLCLTDDPQGIDQCETVPIETNLPGWWAKLVLFKPHAALVGERVVFLDLDTIIVGNADFLLEYNGSFAILRDFYVPTGYGSAIMSIAPGFGQRVWSCFLDDSVNVMRAYQGDQDWIKTMLWPQHVTLWQDIVPGKIVSYKVHCQEGVPVDASIVCFHGVPKPHDLPPHDHLHRVWENVLSY